MATETAAAKRKRLAAELAEAEATETSEVSESTDVAVQKKTEIVMDMSGMESLAVGKDGMVGLESVDQSDIKIPVLQIAQPTSELVADEKAKPGQFYNASTGEVMDSIEASFLQLTKTRVMWPEVFSKGSKPLCRSFDGKQGQGDPGIKCSECEFKDWDNDAGTKPPCGQGYNWLGVNLETSEIFKFTAISSGVKPTKEFLSTYLAKYSKYQLLCYRVKVVTEKVKNTQGTFYVPTYEFIGAVTPAQALEFRDTLDGYKAMFEQELFDAMEQAPIDADSTDINETPAPGSKAPF